MDLIGNEGIVNRINSGLLVIHKGDSISWEQTDIDVEDTHNIPGKLDIYTGEVLSIGYKDDIQEMLISKDEKIGVEYINIKVYKNKKYGILKVLDKQVYILLNTEYDNVYMFGSVIYIGETEDDYIMYIYKGGNIEDCTDYKVMVAIRICNLVLDPVYKKRKQLSHFEVREIQSGKVKEEGVMCIRYKRELKQLLSELVEVAGGSLKEFITDIEDELCKQMDS